MRSNNIRSFPAVDNSTHFLSLLTNTPFEGILAVDTHGIIRFVNDFFVDLIQQERSQLLGAPISKVLPDCRLGDTLARGYSSRSLVLGKSFTSFVMSCSCLRVGGRSSGMISTRSRVAMYFI